MNRKSPTKAIDKEFRRLNAVRSRRRDGVEYQFPDGARKFVLSTTRWDIANDIIAEARRRYGEPDGDRLAGDRIATTRLPAVDMNKLTLTEHAQERYHLMRAQDDLDYIAIGTALTCPMRGLWFEKTGTFGWVGDRVTVVGHVREGWLTIRTFLWTTNDLWEQNPRPDKEQP